MTLRVTGQQLDVPHPSWYRVQECPKCHSREQTFTLVRYGQSSSRKEDQTGSGLHVGGFGAGLHTNSVSLRCDKCAYEEFLPEDDDNPEETLRPGKKVKGEHVVVAGSPFKLPGDYTAKEPILRFPNLTAGRKESKIDKWHKGAIPELTTKLRARNGLADGTPGPFKFTLEELAQWLNEKALLENKVTEAATIDRKTVERWAKKNCPERSND